MKHPRILLVSLCAGLLSFALYARATVQSLPEFTQLVDSYGPAVVNISTKQSQTLPSGPHGFSMPDIPEDSPLYDFFNRFFGEEGAIPRDDIESRSLGSGFIISADGYILTNSHVVEGAEEIIVRTSDRREFVGKLIGRDKRSDIALLKVDATDLPMVKIGHGMELKVGEWVLAIGSPFGFEHSATAGIVSAKGRSLPSENYIPFIQTDVAINPGNSGGPLFNLDGDVVGVNSQIYSRTGGFMGLSFAIPINVAMNVVEQLKTSGRVSRGWLGVLIQDVTRDLAETFGMDQPKGALVAQVLPGSPAEAAGLKAGDVILQFNGNDVSTSSVLPPLVGASPVNQASNVQVLSQGAIKEVQVVIGELPEEDELASVAGGGTQATKANRIGLVVEDPTAEQREQFGVSTGGALVQSVAEGPAEQAGVQAGDLIMMLDNQSIESTQHFKELLDGIEAGRSVAVLVQRGDSRMFFAIRIPQG